MSHTDFDLLLEGASPDEVRRLHKLIREWSDGDENGFPVQLALVTRAQWRVAATIPKLVAQARDDMQKSSLDSERRIVSVLKYHDAEWERRLEQLQKILEANQKKTEFKVTELRDWVTESKTTAAHWKKEFETGSTAWKEAKDSFVQSAKRLNQATADMESRPWRSHWVMMIWLIMAAGIIGWLATKLGYF